MSTFRGIVDEFPDIRIDFFRPIRDRRTPVACFLSHVHSDHLAGLENTNFHGNFLYCSPATKELLLRLEKYDARMNLHRGILETPKLTYKHLKDRLKSIPLDTPTLVELAPGNEIQVTLFDANHCTGAVMFLIEGDNKAILYTGDIRSEPWFVNNLIRNPFLIEYTSGLKRLDCIYLDTSNTRSIPFPTKADGLKELLQKVSKYPADTVFHFSAWTFGYEEVWMALSRALKSQIHVDDYKLGLYTSLRGNTKASNSTSSNTYLSGPFFAHEGPVLAGYKCGNSPQAGCLTSDKKTRIHSCEKELCCDFLDEETVWIRPIITRTKHGEMAEVGVGGGGGDLIRRLELDLSTEDLIAEFLALFTNTDERLMMQIKTVLHDGLRSGRTTFPIDEIGIDQKTFPLTKVAEIVARSIAEKQSVSLGESLTNKVQTDALPRVITFPYSRHSSYDELCNLVRVFDPKDIYPCTVDEANWSEDISIKELFGHDCSATKFRHDEKMRELHAGHDLHCTSQQTHTTATSEVSQMIPSSYPVQHIAQASDSASTFPRRDSRGKMRTFDADGDEVFPPGMKLPNTSPEYSRQTLHSTPPHEITARSPASESQNLRRKAIEDLREEHSKRHCGGPGSSPSAASSPMIPYTYGIREHNLPTVPELCRESDDGVATPGSEVDSPLAPEALSLSITHLSSPILTSNGEEIQSNDDPFERDWDDGDYEIAASNYIDNVDSIVRCKECGHEVWAVWMTRMGFCTHCSSNELVDPYFEIINPEAGPHPEIEPGPYAEILMAGFGRDRRNIVGDYIDEYDTADENPECRSEYNVEDSFIDDASIKEFEHGDEDAASSEGETDYKQVNRELQARYDRLLTTYINLADEHDEMTRDFLGSQWGSSGGLNESDVDKMDGEGALLVPIHNPDPAVTELVLSQAQDQSQESEISPQRLLNRARAFEAAEDGQGWHNISLVSTGDNHTFEEIEL